MFRIIALLLALVSPASAQQYLQIQSCAGTMPAGLNPSAATLTVNPSGQLCVLTGAISVAIPQPDSVVVTTVAGVVSGAYANGAITSEGSTADGAVTGVNQNGSIISILKGIFNNVLTPISVTGSFAVSSPLGVNIASTTPINVTVGGIVSPQNVTVGTSPVAVTIASSPVNVTGSLSVAQTGTNLVQIDGQQIASPTTYGVAPVGSVQGVNAFMTNQPTVVLSGSPVSVGLAGPTPLQITLPSSPVSVGVANQPTVVLSGSPVSVGLVQTPLNVTLATSPVAHNFIQLQGVNIASPSTYGIAPVGSVQGVNAFVTNQPTVVLSGSPVSVGLVQTPLNVTIASSPIAVTQFQSPQNVTINATPLNMTLVALPGTPVSVVQGVTPAYMGLSLPTAGSVIAATVTPVSNLTNTALQIVPAGVHQLMKVVCDGQSASWAFLNIFDAATSGAVTLGTTKAKQFLPLAPGALNGFVNMAPGDGYTNGIVLAVTTTVPTGSSALGTFVYCSVSYN